MPFESLKLREEIQISEIITIHYFEYTSTYHFSGEAHGNFSVWTKERWKFAPMSENIP